VSSPAFVVVCVLDDSHSDWDEVESQCFWFWWYWGLNSGPIPWLSSSPFLWWVFFKIVSCELFALCWLQILVLTILTQSPE
jgi:hypothetical protein